MKLIIEDDEGRKTVVPFVRDEITIGRQEGNTIRLTERNVSRRHARLVRLNGHVVLEDLGSYNGTRINGERVAGQLPLKEGDLIQIGDYDLALQVEGAANAAPTGAITAKVPASRRPEPEEEDAPAPSASQDDAEDEEEDDADGDEHDHTPPSAEARRNATSIIRMDQMEADRPRKVERVPEDEQPRLLVLAPTEFKGQEYDCNRTELRIGRTSENDIALDHRSLSRTHAKVVREATGEWRVIDMQSANGMTVNGESYAQATLSHGDIIEMGHVKLRFVGPGTLSEDLAAQGDRPGSKKLVVGIVVAFLSIAAGAALFVIKGQDLVTPTTDTPPPVVANNPPQVPDKPVAAVGTTPETPQPPPEAPPEPKATEQDFETALTAADFDKARTVLDALRAEKGVPVGKAKDLQQRLTLETQAQQQLAVLEEALKNNKVAEATAAAKTFPKTVVFASRFEELKKQLEEAQRPPPGEATVATNPAQKPSTAPTSDFMRGKTAADVERDITDVQTEVQRLSKAKDIPGALEVAKDCALIAPRLPECHLMLGVLYAKSNNQALSLKHYAQFVTLAPPGHAKRARVIEILSNNSPKGDGSAAVPPSENPPASSNGQ
ncbi:FHA domain-containing protein [Corallococcus sp. CA053C]|nr:FHA domain-containing protein [Corallococcus sp. CA053C]